MNLQSLADRIDCRVEGDGTVEIGRLAAIEQAGPGDLTFIAHPRYLSLAATTRASAVILGPHDTVEGARFSILRSSNPYLSFAKALQLLVTPARPPKGIDRLAAVAATASLGPDASVGPFAVIGEGASIGARAVIYPHVVVGPGAILGDDCVLHARVSIRDRVTIGNRVVILDGAVIGSDGFGFAHQPDGEHLKIPQTADLVIEDDVEIGANSTIDRPALGETRVRAGTKIDNLVHIAHGVQIGRRTLLAAQVGIAGSSIVGDDVMMGGQVGIADHVHIGNRAMFSAKTGVTGNVDPGAFMSGYPMMPNKEWRKAQVLVRRLPEMKKRVAELEQRIAELEEKLAACLMRLEK